MKTKITVGLMLLGFSGCLVTRNEMRENETRRQTQDQAAIMQRTAAADAAQKQTEVEATVRELSGRLDVVENRVGQADQSSGRSQKVLEDQLNDTNRRMALLQEEVAKLESQVQSLSEQMASGHRDEPRVEEKTTKGEKKTPFDIGEEFFQKKEWRKAILNYQKYRDQFPKGKKFPESTYKIGVCFQELGMKDEAKTFYDELVAKFPGSQEARRAKIRLKKIK